MIRLILVFTFLFFIFPIKIQAFEFNLDGWLRTDNRYIVDSPEGFNDFEHLSELRIGGNGDFFRINDWTLDYEVLLDNRYRKGPSEQAGFVPQKDLDFFRAWMRIDAEKWRLRGGRQQILFGAGALFRPLGIFDTRIISGVFPQTGGIDGFRFSYFVDETTTVQSWVVPAKANDRVLVGGRWEVLFAGVETGVVAQYSPRTQINFLPNFDLELLQFGYHLKGEHEFGYWNEGRFDIQSHETGGLLRFDTVFGVDYTFDFGEGLHVLLEYFLSASERGFTNGDLRGDRILHQFGLQFDQPVGIAMVWRSFFFIDLLDGSFQIAPQIEYAVTEQVYLYLQGNYGGDINGEDRLGRLFRKGPNFSGTESSAGLSIIVFF